MKQLFLMEWTEYERGWGKRPDGISLHLTEQHARSSASAYDYEFNTEAEAPDEYTVAERTSIQPVTVSDELYAHIEKTQAKFTAQGKRYAGTIGGNFKNLADAEAVAIKVMNNEKSPKSEVRS